MSNNEKIKKIIASVPDSPGVYLMKDGSGRVIYVGKAKLLKKRLNSYLARDLDSKTVALMSHVSQIDYQLCNNESMALLLEASLIRKYKPKYNVALRDDKSYPLVKVTNETFPRVLPTRKKEADGARYLGPFTSAKLLRSALKIIRRSFGFRSCNDMPKRACIYYRIKLCPGPCIGKISRTEYAKLMNNICLLLEGKADALLGRLSGLMRRKSSEQKFEEAARLRDQIIALSAVQGAKPGFSLKDELEDLKELLKLDKLPLRIEAFDISNVYGKEATGSMVSFCRGLPDKDNYRRFRIKGVEKIDDYAMMAEVVSRRYYRVLNEELALPDLILVDGGRAHLLTVQKELKKLNIDVSTASIAKEEEHIYCANRNEPIKLDHDTPALNLIRRIRDEAHRFAVSYHHVLRRKKIIGK
ncbi:MAG: excinuclease ABC subunit UvrC [Candidatus Omnitrophica bacterium]|nr:excinuclease ABC subunit UvrC [Candidatus Omnitrophota bacterium]MBU1869449.1 excinuclease ABC subunit UvrC [Candidatus Omnitrophota bacterium]